MGNQQSGPGGGGPGEGGEKKKEEKKKYEPPPPPRTGRKKVKKGPESNNRLPLVTPNAKCKLRLLKLERIKDYLLMEEEFIQNQERLKPQEEKSAEERAKVDELRGTPMGVGNLEEMIDEDHAIVSSSVGPEYYVNIMSFVDRDLLEPGCSVLTHNKVLSIVGILADDVDPLVSVMKVDKAPLETYADIGGLEAQIQEIKEAVELPMTHPELYEDIGIKPPKGVILYGPPGTGKTLLAKAVANQTSATFLRIVGSELIQKYLGDGPKLVREMFRLADDQVFLMLLLPACSAAAASFCSLQSRCILRLLFVPREMRVTGEHGEDRQYQFRERESRGSSGSIDRKGEEESARARARKRGRETDGRASGGEDRHHQLSSSTRLMPSAPSGTTRRQGGSVRFSALCLSCLIRSSIPS
jgi:hypothetical protein